MLELLELEALLPKLIELVELLELFELAELELLLELTELLELSGVQICRQQFWPSYSYLHPTGGISARHGSLDSIVLATTCPPGPQSIAELLLPLLELLEVELVDELLDDPAELEFSELADELELLVLLLRLPDEFELLEEEPLLLDEPPEELLTDELELLVLLLLLLLLPDEFELLEDEPLLLDELPEELLTDELATDELFELTELELDPELLAVLLELLLPELVSELEDEDDKEDDEEVVLLVESLLLDDELEETQVYPALVKDPFRVLQKQALLAEFAINAAHEQRFG